jgi:hypothetical protein
MFRLRVLVLALVALLFGVTAIALAQDTAPIAPLVLSASPVVLEYTLGAAGPPTIEPLTDSRMTFRIQAAGEVSGDVEGSLSAAVSEVTAMPSPALHPVTVSFTIETEHGMLSGFYAGSLYLPDGADAASIDAAGLILSVSGAYADLYLAEVYVDSSVQFVDGRSVGESGAMTIVAR